MTKSSQKQAPKAKPKPKISQQHEDFARQYLIDLNATQAAIRAGYSEKTAYSQGHRLLKNAEIQNLIAELRKETAERLELTRDDCIRQYQRIGFSDPRRLFSADGSIKGITELDDDTAAAVQGYEIECRRLDGPDSDPVPVLKIKWADRRAALDSIMRGQGWNLPDKVELTGKGGGPLETVTRIVKVPTKTPAEVITRPLKAEGDQE